MVVLMRIDTSTMLLAAQAQTRPAAAVKTPQTSNVEPASMAAKPAASSAQPGMQSIKRLGQQLDIKV
jgi:hypothetical protein